MLPLAPVSRRMFRDILRVRERRERLPSQPSTRSPGRLGRAFASDQEVDGLTAPALRAWIVGLQATIAPVSIAGFVRTLKAFGNWLHADELADAAALRGCASRASR